MSAIDLGLPSPTTSGLAGVPTLDSEQSLTRKQFIPGGEVRWCPGCGDYAVLAAVQSFLPDLGLRRENIVFVSGIGCSSRFPYYLDTFGVHSIHGRAPAFATGLAVARPDLNVWVVTGDGDALSIGAGHLLHTLRRNVNLTILLFNNRIYGLTKGQYSPTSESGKVTKSTPVGSVDAPFNPVSLALGAEATFVARTLDSDRAHLTSVLRAAAEHRGTALVEIYQNCPIFNDGAFDVLKDSTEAQARVVRLRAGEPVTFGGPDGQANAVVARPDGGGVEVMSAEWAGAQGRAAVVHDPSADDPAAAFALSRLDDVTLSHVPIGIFRDVARPAYDDLVRGQVDGAVSATGGHTGDDDLAALLAGSDTWTVS